MPTPFPRIVLQRLEELRADKRHVFIYGPLGVGKHTLLAELDKQDCAEDRIRHVLDSRAAKEKGAALDALHPIESVFGTTLLDVSAPSSELQGIYPHLLEEDAENREPFRTSSIDGDRFSSSMNKAFIRRVEECFPAVRIFPLSFREAKQIDDAPSAYEPNGDPALLFPCAKKEKLLKHILVGGLPVMQGLETTERCRKFDAYVGDLKILIAGDDADLGDTVVRLLRSLARRPGRPFCVEAVAREIDRSYRAVKQAYVRGVELNLLSPVYPVDGTVFSRPLSFFFDTGLLCYLKGIKTVEALERHPDFEAVFAQFLVSEIEKNRAYCLAKEGFEFFFQPLSDTEIDECFEEDEKTGFPFQIVFATGNSQSKKRSQASLSLCLEDWAP